MHWRVEAKQPGEEAVAVVKVTEEGQVFSLDIIDAEALEKTAIPPGEHDAFSARLDSISRATDASIQLLFGRPHIERVVARTALAGRGLRLDSTAHPPGRNVAYLGGGRVADRDVTATLTFDEDGRLLELEPSYAAAPAAEHSTTWLTVLALATYVLGIVAVLIAFFKRLSDRLVDMKAAVRDALWMALAGTVWIVMSSSRSILEMYPNSVTGYGIIVFNATIVSLGVAFMAFAASGASESVARPVWPDRLASLSLVRNGFWYDARVGSAFVRGLAGGGVAVGALAVALSLAPHVQLYLGTGASGQSADEVALSTGPWLLAFHSLIAFIQVYIVLMALGAGLHRKLGAWALVLAGLVLLPMQLVVITATPLSMLALHAIPVALAVVLFYRHDALTALVMLAAYGTLWDSAYLWLSHANPSRTGGLVVLGVLVLLFVAGLVGMLRGKTVREDRMLVPSYIRERQHEARIERELEIAHTVQMSFLPRAMPQVPGLDVAGLCLPAMEVGGDYYDFIELGDGRLAVVIGDVSGKGIQAAFFMTLVKGVVRTLAREGRDPGEVLSRANRVFFESAPRGTFISMIYGVVDVRARTFTFARAGHNPVILRRAPSQQADILQPPGMALGLDAGPRFDASLRVETLGLSVGDMLVFYTDGFSEAMNLDRALYGDDTLAAEASKSHGAARHTLDALTHGVSAFMNGASQHDDMTMIVLKLVG